MPLILSAEERAVLAAAQRQSRNVRHWQQYQAAEHGATQAEVLEVL